MKIISPKNYIDQLLKANRKEGLKLELELIEYLDTLSESERLQVEHEIRTYRKQKAFNVRAELNLIKNEIEASSH